MHRLRCTACGQTGPAAFFCGACEAIQAPALQRAWLQLLDLPERPAIDQKLLEKRYYELSRRLHPDRVQATNPQALPTSVRAASILNEAYRTLRDPELRGRWWLEHQGGKLGSTNSSVPTDIAAFVFETHETLLDAQSSGGAKPSESIEAILVQVQEQRHGHLEQLASLLEGWPPDAAEAARLISLRDLLVALSYLATLQRDVLHARDGLEKTSPEPRQRNAAGLQG